MKVLIVGAGPAGLLMANYLMGRSGYDVQIIERGPDPRLLPRDTIQSYPVQLQERGLAALRDVAGLEKEVVDQGIWPSGVCFHQGTKIQKFPLDPPKLFVDHSKTTLTLLEHLDSAEKAVDTSLSIQFDCCLTELNLDQKQAKVTSSSNKSPSQSSFSFDKLVAADGGNSKVRQQLENLGEINAEQKEIPDSHRNIYLSTTTTSNPESSEPIQLDTDSLHAWVFDEGRIRVIAAPFQKDTLCGAFVFEKVHDPFEQLKSPQDVHNYLQQHSPEVLAKLVTDQEATELVQRSSSSLVTVKCDRLHVKDCVLLLGDSAHAMTQGVGHGCISALQDVQIFCQLLDQYQDDWTQALPAYTKARLEDAHALFTMCDYAKPAATTSNTSFSNKLLNIEWGVRQLARKILPSFIGKRMRPLPVELLSDTTLPYREVLQQSQWWIDRVKKQQEKQTQ